MSSVLHYQEKKRFNEVQIWNNAAFDNGRELMETEVLIESDHHSSKENRSPNCNKYCGPTKSAVFGKEKDIDLEIEKTEKEINRLSIRLELLQLEKAKRTLKVVDKKGRVIAAKFKEPPKQIVQTEEGKVDEFKTPRRGLSVGPMEIMKATRRGVNLRVNEIHSGSKLKGTPGGSAILNRRKSCYWMLEGIDELRATKARGESLSLSPKSRLKFGAKTQAVGTSGVKKTVKKEDGVVQPKKLFVNEGDRLGKKPLKSDRVVPSRYNVGSNGGSFGNKEIRKRSLNGNEDAESKRVTKKWEIASQLEYKTPLSVSKMLHKVPKIRTMTVMNESPRDSGAAKRVSELVGKKSFFHLDDENEGKVRGNESFECSKIRLLGCVVDSPRVSQSNGNKSFFDHDDDDEMPVFSFEEED